MRTEPIEVLWTAIALLALAFSALMLREYALDYRAAREIEDAERRRRGRDWTRAKIEREAFRAARLLIFATIGVAACWAPAAVRTTVTVFQAIVSVGLFLAACLDAVGVYREWMHWRHWRRDVLDGSRNEVDERKHR